MENNGKGRLFNVLAIVMLVATACLVGFYGLIAVDVVNPFPPPTVASLDTPTPTLTPTPGGPTLPPTWTPTPAGTDTPIPTPTNTRTPTPTSTTVPTFPPTETSEPTATNTPTVTTTPLVTRSPLPFTYEVQLRRPVYDTPWTGVAGHVQDLDGDPLPGYHVQIRCPGVSEVETPRAGADENLNVLYGNTAAWERSCDSTQYQAMAIRVQLFEREPQPDGTYEAVSREVVVNTGGYPSASLGYVIFTLNWQELQPEND